MIVLWISQAKLLEFMPGNQRKLLSRVPAADVAIET